MSLNKTYQDLLRLSFYALACLFFAEFGLSFLWDYLSNSVFNDSPVDYGSEVSFSFMVSILVIAPLLETLIFQLGIHSFFGLFKRALSNKSILSVLSGVLFGLTHYYSVTHIIKSSLIGIVFMFFFLETLSITNKKSAFWFIVVIHSLWNFIIWIIRNLINYNTNV